ncbi:MAG: DNA polymerase IV [Eubacterium sp.]|nr:DNA polymerase IV [Eubacterium sp.]
MEEKIIFHVDVNSAFLSWSALQRLEKDPGALDLRTVPSAVGGDRASRRGVITAKSIPAKKYGVTTGEPVVKALEKCPDLILVQADFQYYRKKSRAFIAILHEYTDLVQQASIDEAYVDVTDVLKARLSPVSAGSVPRRLHNPAGNGNCTDYRESIRSLAVSLADEIRSQVSSRLKFTVNVGISSNKLLAKMASDFTKPDRTHTLWPEEVPDKMWPLPIGNLYGCGRKTAEKLAGIGISTIGQAAHADRNILVSILGEKAGDYILNSSRGYGSAHVQELRDDAKSYSSESTTPEDITRENFDAMMPPLLHELSESVSRRMKKDGVYGNTVAVMVKTDTFQRRSRQRALSSATSDANRIYREASGLVQELLFGSKNDPGLYSQGYGIRLVGVRMSGLDKGEYRQVTLEDFITMQAERRRKEAAKAAELKKQEEKIEKARKLREKEERMDSVMEKLKKKYGEQVLRRGTK